MPFPKDFAWGVATSSYQIEGTQPGDGRGASIWDTFSHTPGKVRNGDTGDVANEHLTRYPQDIALMKEIGVNSYRFSIAWPRVLPAGTGAVNEIGVDFYDDLVDRLLEAGITPFVTVYHWDLPQALQDRGGWENPDSVAWFADYADVISRALGDRVKHWITHNEPWVASMVGNLLGVHAPGKIDPEAAFTVAHHLLLSHGAAVPVIRASASGADVGITLDQAYSWPETSSEADRAAARRWAGFHNDWFLEPVFRGVYPADIVRLLEPTGVLKRFDPAAISAARVPIDFLGINYYMRNIVRDDPNSPLLGIAFGRTAGAEHTAMDWEVYPDGLLKQLLYIHHAYYPLKLYVTENGCAYDDPPPVDGRVHDPKRVEYYRLHLDAVEQAIALGVPMGGYFAWSLMDNFEWAEGYDKRFGIVYVDYATQQRTLKDSALYYRDRIASARA